MMFGTTRIHRIVNTARRVVTRARDRIRLRRLRRKAAAIDRELEQLGQGLLHEAPCPP